MKHLPKRKLKIKFFPKNLVEPPPAGAGEFQVAGLSGFAVNQVILGMRNVLKL
jgi:hypothetical protein